MKNDYKLFINTGTVKNFQQVTIDEVFTYIREYEKINFLASLVVYKDRARMNYVEFFIEYSIWQNDCNLMGWYNEIKKDEH